jgi:hypothetical protein
LGLRLLGSASPLRPSLLPDLILGGKPEIPCRSQTPLPFFSVVSVRRQVLQKLSCGFRLFRGFFGIPDRLP